MTGDIIALSPPLIIEKSQIDELIGTHRDRDQGSRVRSSTLR